ncbi:MAG: topoisomerase DNA-binding C4 zinc finger domain-containing protein, partial [Candidatus Dormibacteraceae bacterium]
PCPECGEGTLLLRASRYGTFKGCSRYPECRYRVDSKADGSKLEPQLLEERCPQCNSQLQVRRGRYGEFVGCSGYPECRYIKKEEKEAPTPTGEKCPQCGEGEVVERKGRYGPFLACNRYPECKYRGGRPGGASAEKSENGEKGQAELQLLDEQCPECGKPMVERKGRYGPFKSCSDYPRCKGPKKSAKSARKTKSAA